MIPLVDLRAQYRNLRHELTAAIDEVVNSQVFVNANKVRSFENACSAKFGVENAIGCSSGTSALFLALNACGIGPGDEVIVPAMTFIATAEAVSACGAVPVFADIDPGTYQLDIASAENLITSRAKAIIVVHLYGNCSDMDALTSLCRKRGLALIEDCAQSHLTRYKSKAVGGFGAAAAFSFYPGKNLGAFGDAGMVVTNDAATASTIRKLIDHGRVGKYEHSIIGFNHRMDEIQAAVLLVKLKYLEEWNACRRKIASRYCERFQTRGLKVMRVAAEIECSYHLYVVEVSNRDEVIEAMTAAGIATGIHYPKPLHLQRAYSSQSRNIRLPIAELTSKRLVSLPIFPALTEAEADRICDVFLENSKK